VYPDQLGVTGVCPDARDELTMRERLHDVVVGTHIERANFVVHRLPSVRTGSAASYCVGAALR